MTKKVLPSCQTLQRTAFFTVFCLWAFSALAAVRYVKPTATGTGDGSSWDNASGNLQAMINLSAADDEVWVAAGTYKPTSGTDRTIAFRMRNNVSIYGGFFGNETNRNQRNFVVHITTLSGDLNGDDNISGSGSTLSITNNGENSYRVIYNDYTSSDPLTSSAVLDGFTIRGGCNQVSSIGPYHTGGGMNNLFASPTLSNLIFIGNRAQFGGGGLFNSLNSSPILTNVIFQQNYSQNNGGGMYCFTNANAVLNNVTFTGNLSYGSFGGGAIANFENSPTFNNCLFSNNFASSAAAVTNVGVNATFINCSFTNNGVFQDAGCMYIENSTINFFNCLFSGNIANLYAGCLYVRSSTVNATNCVFWNHSARPSHPYNQSGVMNIDGTNPSVTINNSIIWNNQSHFLGEPPVISHSIVQGGYTAGTSILDTDPLFVDAANGNLRLNSCSPAINAGINAAVPMSITTDLDGNPRFYNSGTVDMGAYEFQGEVLIPLPPTGALAILNSTCTDCMVSGGSISTGTVSGTGGTLEYSTDGGTSWSSTLPTYNQTGPVQTILASVVSSSGCRSTSTQVGQTSPGTCVAPSAPTGALTILNSTCTDCMVSGGSISTGTVSGTGGTLEYSTDGGTSWSSTLPSYNQTGPAQTILASVVSSNGCRSTSTQVGQTSPGTCVAPSAPTGALTIINSTCTDCMVSGGSISAGTVSGTGGTLEYSTDGGTSWSSTLPTYNQTGPTQTILASVISSNGCRSISTQVGQTSPGTCASPSAPTGALAILNSTCTDCMVSGGNISIGTVSGAEGTLEYSTDGGTSWSSTLPTYNQTGPAQTILASVISSNGCRSTSTQVGQTSPGTCVTPSAPTGALAIINSTCIVCEVSGGNISTGTLSSTGGTLEYSTDGGTNWSSTLPTYTQTGPAQTILASVLADNGCRTSFIQVGETMPDTCDSSLDFILYVNANATGANNGTSWASAFTFMQDALALAGQCSNVIEIWVAEGLYRPDEGIGYTTGNRNHSFEMKNNLAIYGGFPNIGNPTFADRNWAAYETILSGDIGTNGENDDNSYHVIFNNGLNNSAILDGFIITMGNADALSPQNDRGGGMYNNHSSPAVTNCLFSGNTANLDGGGMYNFSSSPTVTNCGFTGNMSSFGSGMYNNESSPSVTNCSFSGNLASQGSGMYNHSSSSSPVVTNCSFFENLGNSGSIIYNDISSSPFLANCILWGNIGIVNYNSLNNPTVTYSVVQGGYTGLGNLDVDPLFVDTANGNLRLQFCSPAINAGSNDAVSSGITTDLDGNPRFYNDGKVDMGAYEYQDMVFETLLLGEIQSVGETICHGGTASEIGSMTAASGGDGSIRYSWRSSADGYTDAIIGATGASYTPPSGLTTSTTFRRYAVDATCYTTAEQSSGEWTVTVYPIFTAGAIETSGFTLCFDGEPEDIGHVTSASGGDGNITYSWRSSEDNFTTNISGATGATYTPPTGYTGMIKYRRYAQDGLCNTTPQQSSGEWEISVPDQFSESPMVLNAKPIAMGIYKTTSTITSAGDVESSTEVIVKSAVTVTLLPGFHAKAGSHFRAVIEECEEDIPESSAQPQEVTLRMEDLEVESMVSISGHVTLAVYPNPFMSETVLEYGLDVESEVELHLFSITGTLMRVMQPIQIMPEGIHRIRMEGENLPPGICYVRLRAGKEVITRKVVVVR